MEDDRKETVVVHEHDDKGRNPIGWIIALILVILLVIAFLAYGGFGLFGGAGTGGDTNVNVQAPESVTVPTTTGQ